MCLTNSVWYIVHHNRNVRWLYIKCWKQCAIIVCYCSLSYADLFYITWVTGTAVSKHPWWLSHLSVIGISSGVWMLWLASAHVGSSLVWGSSSLSLLWHCPLAKKWRAMRTCSSVVNALFRDVSLLRSSANKLHIKWIDSCLNLYLDLTLSSERPSGKFFLV